MSMNKKIKRVTGGVAIYYGLFMALTTIGVIAMTFFGRYQIIAGEREFSWGELAVMLIITLISGLLAYALLRTGRRWIDN